MLPQLWQSGAVRWTVTAAAALLAAASWMTPPVAAEPTACDDAYCTPGIAPGVVLGAPCDNLTYFVFGTTSWGRLVFCGSPRRYEPRFFRSPSMVGIKQEGANCYQYAGYVAQAPDGLFLSCAVANGETVWVRGDL